MKCRLMPLAALFLMSSSPAFADTPAQARKAIEGIYAREQAALGRKDIDSVFSCQTPDYVAITKTGKRIPRDQANQFGRQITMMQTVKASSRIMSFALKGDTALARAKNHIYLTTMNPQTNQPISVTIDGVEEDTWVKRGGKWLLKQSREITRTQKISGKK